MILAPLLHKTLLKEEIKNENPQKKEENTEKVIAKEPTKTVAKPLGTARISEFSIQKFSEEKEKIEEDSLNLVEEKLPENHFSETDLQTEWAKFLRGLSSSNEVTYNAVQAFKLSKIEESKVEVSYSSESARKEFEAIEGDFFNHFKHKVNNFRIEVVYKDAPDLRKSESSILSKRQIFNKWSEINPLLNELNDLMKFDFS